MCIGSFSLHSKWIGLSKRDPNSSVLRRDVIAGDWNCTEHFNVDRNSKEPNFQSGVVLSKLIQEHDLTDVWRNRNEGIKQYTWIKVSNNEVKGVRLDGFYMSKSFNNRVMDAVIIPSGFSDHNMITIDINKIKKTFSSIIGILIKKYYIKSYL